MEPNIIDIPQGGSYSLAGFITRVSSFCGTDSADPARRIFQDGFLPNRSRDARKFDLRTSESAASIEHGKIA